MGDRRLVRAVIGRRGPTGAWRADISDAQEMARLRARVVTAAALLGLLSMLVTTVVSPRTYLSGTTLAPLWTVLGLIGFAIWSAWRGDRQTDVEFFLLVAVAQLFAAVTTDLYQPGQVSRVGLCLLAPVLVAAVFTERLALLSLQPVVAVAALLLVARHAPAASGPAMDVSVGGFSLVAVTGVVRLLREQAVRALRTAKTGEITDPLTGLTNRRGLERLGAQVWRARAREQLPLAVLVIDVDHFKRINDSLGHAAGDDILRRLAGQLTAVVRAGDVAVRLGGEEFLLLCPSAPGGGTALGERIRATVEHELPGVTVSVGVDETVPSVRDPLPGALWSGVDRADRALYRAKESGRNRVVAAQPANN